MSDDGITRPAQPKPPERNSVEGWVFDGATALDLGPGWEPWVAYCPRGAALFADSLLRDLTGNGHDAAEGGGAGGRAPRGDDGMTDPESWMLEAVPGRPMHRCLIDEPLTVEDWDDLYNFWRFVWCPFAERIVRRARKRANLLRVGPEQETPQA